MQKPKVGEYYKVQKDFPNEPYNLMKIIKVERNFAFYIKLNWPDHILRWDFKRFPECLCYKLTPVEEELL